MRSVLPGADPKTFTVLPYPGVDGWVAYGKDAAHVYYLSIVATEIAGADPATFTVSEKGAFDKNHRFLHEMIWDKP